MGAKMLDILISIVFSRKYRLSADGRRLTMSKRMSVVVTVTVVLAGISALVLVARDTPPPDQTSTNAPNTTDARGPAVAETTDSSIAIVGEEVGNAVAVLPEGTSHPDKAPESPTTDSVATVDPGLDKAPASGPTVDSPAEAKDREGDDLGLVVQPEAVVIEEVPVESVGAGEDSATKAETVTDNGKVPDPLGPVPLDPGSSEDGKTYMWQDGDRTLSVTLEPDLTVGDDGAIVSKGDLATSGGEGNDVPRGTGSGGGSAELPVFRSGSGNLMALPGGVTLSLDPEWTVTEVDAFFSKHRIAADRISELEWLPNGFFIETEAGFPSLDLANQLAGRKGVVFATPNWWTELTNR